MAYKVLRQEEVLQILEGRESIIPSIAEADEDARGKISEQECPECGEALEPRIPRDPSKVFRGTSINYEKWCPRHGHIT